MQYVTQPLSREDMEDMARERVGSDVWADLTNQEKEELIQNKVWKDPKGLLVEPNAKDEEEEEEEDNQGVNKIPNFVKPKKILKKKRLQKFLYFVENVLLAKNFSFNRQ